MAVTQSLYQQYLADGIFGRTALAIAETYNGKDVKPGYLHNEILRKKRSLNGRWESAGKDNVPLMADYVSTNSSLPLKSRDSIATAGGKLPKLGQHLWLDEEQLEAVEYAQAMGFTAQQIRALLLQDLPLVIQAVKERMEDSTLYGLSHGEVLIDTENVGIGLRVDYNYKAANKLGVATLWSNTAADIFADMERALALAPNNKAVFLDKAALGGIYKNAAAKDYFGFIRGFAGNNTPNLNDAAAGDVLKDKYGFTDVVIVDRQTTYEIDGVRTTRKSWKDGTIVLAPSKIVGELQWASFPEMNRPVAGVNYQVVDEYILTSQFRDQQPFFTEHTKSQAKALPVIQNVPQIVTIDTKTVQA